jgi:putative ABC transport system ATP-binding protein
MIVHPPLPSYDSQVLPSAGYLACPTQWAVRVKGVHKAYRRGGSSTAVLNGVDLAVAAGECVFLAGPSGSGKTTLLSILGCILTADRGRVEILDQDVLSLDAAGRVLLRRDRIGFVFQRFHLIRGLTALENVCVPLVLRGTSPRAGQRRGRELLQAVGLAEKVAAQPQNLSAGECQRVALARALAGDPELILADEPTASLDAANGPEVMKLLRRLTTNEGKTAIVVTHDQRIFPFADRVLWLENGRVAESNPLVSASAGGVGAQGD